MAHKPKRPLPVRLTLWTLGIVVFLLIIRVLIALWYINETGFQVFRMRGDSMVPALCADGYASSYPYTAQQPPERGDIAVLAHRKGKEYQFIKRIIGLPGDTVQIKHGIVFLNNKPIPRRRLEDKICTDKKDNPVPIRQYEETLDNDVFYSVLDIKDDGPFDNTQIFTVPPDHYFVLGDNRDRSIDSRSAQRGFIPAKDVVAWVDEIGNVSCDD